MVAESRQVSYNNVPPFYLPFCLLAKYLHFARTYFIRLNALFLCIFCDSILFVSFVISMFSL